jgi:iron-sulfur cluster repair protein YtfE (RIC family)
MPSGSPHVTTALASPAAKVATSALRQVRARLRLALGAIADRVGRVAAAPEGSGGARREIAGDIDETLRPHLEWEERAIHPIVDKFACEGPAAFSASMRYEHEIIHRWLAEIARLAEGDDARAFARRVDNLLGLVLAHFELEEQVLFPILDRAMSPDAFRPIERDAPRR